MKNKFSGIYKIQSIIKPNRIYIGSAINIGRRWSEHLIHLKYNRHFNEKLQNHYNKYGKSDLQFSILLGCDKEDLIKIEQFFIDSFNPFFNICKNARNKLGFKCSIETKLKLSEGKKGNKNPISKKVINTETGEIFNTIIEVSLKYHINKITLWQYLSGKRKNKTIFKLYN